MKKGYIIYAREDLERNREFAQRFVKYGPEYGLDIGILKEEQIVYGIESGLPHCGVSPCDFAINRARNAYLARFLEERGARVFNSSEVTRLCNDKCAAYLFAVGKIPCLDTYILKRRDLLQGAAKLCFFPCVIKQLTSHGGQKVFLCGNYAEAFNAAEQVDGEYAIVQRPLAEEGISDIRVFVMGNRIIGAVRRKAKDGIKANFCQGGEISLYQVGGKLKGYVERLTQKLYFDFVGMDFLTADDEHFYFNEIEDAVGSRSLCILKGIDTSRIYLNYIKDILK
jgi:glutathione synthase/RimK-type ligase-like ATP-grasp enzyme